MTTPRVIIIAGPNGAGKTTFAREFLPQEAGLLRFINADLIAAGLSPFAPESVAIKAGRLLLNELADCEARRESFALETTLSGQAYLRHVSRWKAAGYRVVLFFLSLPSAEVAIERVARRVRQGGHRIPEDVIRRRFRSGRLNFDRSYRRVVDAWAHYANAGDEVELVEWGEARFNDNAAYQAKDKDLMGSIAAMKRAAETARQIAVRTDTAVMVHRIGEGIVEITADALRKAGYK